MRLFIFLIFNITASFFFKAQAGDNLISSQELRFDYGGRMIVEVNINDTGPHNFVVDTASTTMVIFQNMARTIDVTPIETPDKNIISFAGSKNYPVSRIESLTVGNRELVNIDAIVLPDWDNFVRTPQGILGLDFFEDHVAVFDLENNKLEIYKERPSFLKTKNRKRKNKWANVPLKRENFDLVSTPLFLVPIKFGYRELHFLLDTGAEASVCNFASADFLRVIPKRARTSNQKATVSDAVGKRAESFIFTPSRVRIAGIERKDRSLLISDSPFFDAIGYGEEPFGLVGLNYLLDASFAIDFKTGTLFIRKSD